MEDIDELADEFSHNPEVPSSQPKKDKPTIGSLPSTDNRKNIFAIALVVTLLLLLGYLLATGFFTGLTQPPQSTRPLEPAPTPDSSSRPPKLPDEFFNN